MEAIKVIINKDMKEQLTYFRLGCNGIRARLV